MPVGILRLPAPEVIHPFTWSMPSRNRIKQPSHLHSTGLHDDTWHVCFCTLSLW